MSNLKQATSFTPLHTQLITKTEAKELAKFNVLSNQERLTPSINETDDKFNIMILKFLRFRTIIHRQAPLDQIDHTEKAQSVNKTQFSLCQENL